MATPRSAFDAPVGGNPTNAAAGSVSRRRPGAAWRKAAWYAAAVVALAAVFAAYMSPHLIVDLASRVWSCF